MVYEINKDNYPKIGSFYYYMDSIIAPDNFQRCINLITFKTESIDSITSPMEHRDMWDKYMLIKYPEIKEYYDDDHKALPRGSVDYSLKNNKPSFFITLDKCIKLQEDEIKTVYNLNPYIVNFLYGVMNYKCKNCDFHESHLPIAPY